MAMPATAVVMSYLLVYCKANGGMMSRSSL